MTDQPKTEAQIARIRRGLETNNLFRYLDEEQKQKYMEVVRLETFPKGSTIVQERAVGHHFYVVESGEVSLSLDIGDGNAHHSGTLGPGDSFGEKAMFYDTRRSGSARAETDSQCWVVDRPTFHKVLTASTQKRNVFDGYASLTDQETKHKVMRPSDFVKSMLPVKEWAHLPEDDLMQSLNSRYPKLATLFEVVDRNNSGSLNFLEYCLFDVIASKPDPFFDFAFLLFDEGKKGFVTKQDFENAVIKHGRAPNFNFDSSPVTRFFGKDGQRRLRFLAFSELFVLMQEEIPRQAFLQIDQTGNGKLDGDSVIQLLQEFGHWRMPPNVLERVAGMKGFNPGGQGCTYSEFVAFNNLLNHLPSILMILRQATEQTGNRQISKADFMQAAQSLHAVRPSPIELNIVYNLLDVNKSGTISAKEFMDFIGMAPKNGTAGMAQKHESGAGASKAKEATINFVLGSIAGAIGALCVYPIDFVKTRMQNQPYDAKGRGLMYSSIFDCFQKTVKNERLLGLYRGAAAQMVGVAPEKAIKLATNDLLRSMFKNDDKPLDLPLEILAGGFAGGMQVFFTNPYELVKIRLQVQGEKMKDPAYRPKSAVAIVKEIGLGGLYKGAGACWLRDIPFSAVYFPLYARVKSSFGEPLKKTDLLLAGAIAGAPAAYFTTPADVIKTRLQADAKGAAPRFLGITDCFRKTLREEGWRTFFVGGGMRVFRSSPQFAVTLLVYEVLQKQFAPGMEAPRPMVMPPVSEQEYQKASLLRKIIPVL